VGPVDYPRSDELRVGDDDGDVVHRANQCGSETDIHHVTPHVADGYPVTYLYWAFKEDDKAGDEVGSHVLKPESDPHA